MRGESDDPIQHYPSPPGNDEIYSFDTWERMFVSLYFMERTIVAGALRPRTWKYVFGAEPTRPFPTSGSNRKK